MKKNYRFVCIMVCLIVCNTNGIVWGKQATIVFNTDRTITVSIYKPIDDACNYNTVSDQLELKPNISIAYKLDVLDFCFVKIAYSNGMQYSLIIQENDNVDVTFRDNGIVLEGSNSKGNVYLNNFKRYAHVDSIFDLHLKPSVDIAAIHADLHETFWKGFNEDLEGLRSDENVSSEFIRILSNDIGYAVTGMIVSDYYKVISGYKGEISPEDSVKIITQIDSLYQIYPPWANDVMKYRYSSAKGYLAKYYYEKYKCLSIQEQNALLQTYEQDAFGPYRWYLLAPDHIQLPGLGSAFIFQLDYLVDEFNKDKMLKYVETHFPDSQYLQLIKKRLKEIAAKNKQPTASNDSIIIIHEPVNTLQELFSLHSLSGHRLYIDLWATWCLPCKTEFLHKEGLYPVAEEYNVKLVYLSIDKADFKKLWESEIFKLNLNGYHLLANESLMKDIEKVIYKNSVISIPRYVYVNEKGEIVNHDAPRPSSIDKIENLFSGE